MSILQTPNILLNEGIDKNPIELRSPSSVENTTNTIVKLEGIYRRPPIEFIKDYAPKKLPEYTQEIIDVWNSAMEVLYFNGVPYLVIALIGDNEIGLTLQIDGINLNDMTKSFHYLEDASTVFPTQTVFSILAMNHDACKMKLLKLDDSNLMIYFRDNKGELISTTINPNITNNIPNRQMLIRIEDLNDNDAVTFQFYATGKDSSDNPMKFMAAKCTVSYQPNTMMTWHLVVDQDTLMKTSDGMPLLDITYADNFDSAYENTSNSFTMVIRENFINEGDNNYYTPLLSHVEVEAAFKNKVSVYFTDIGDPSVLPSPIKNNIVMSIAKNNQVNSGYYVKYSDETNSYQETVQPIDIDYDTEHYVTYTNANSESCLFKTLKINPFINEYRQAFTVLKVNTSSNTVTLNRKPFAPRYVGDKKSAPDPSFFTNTIKDMLIFQGRLWILTDRTLVASRINDYFNFYPSTAKEILLTDPIDIEIGDNLEYLMLYNNSLLVIGKNQQYLVTANSNIFTINTIVVIPSTSYEIDTDVKPITFGSSVLFIGTNNMLYEYISRYETVQTEAIAISNKYPLEHKVLNMIDVNSTYAFLQIASTEFIVMTHKNFNDSMYRVFSTVDFQVPVLQMATHTYLYLLSDAGDFQYAINKLNLIKLTNKQLLKTNGEKNINLDFKSTFSSLSITYDDAHNISTITLPSVTNNTFSNKLRNKQLIKEDNEYIGYTAYITMTNDNDNITFVIDNLEGDTIELTGDYTEYTATVTIGYRYTSTIDFQQYLPLDKNRQPLTYKRLSYRKFSIDYIGNDFIIDYGSYYLNNTGVILNETLWDDISTMFNTLSIRLAGYKDTYIKLHTKTIMPLLVTNISYILWYQPIK